MLPVYGLVSDSSFCDENMRYTRIRLVNKCQLCDQVVVKISGVKPLNSIEPNWSGLLGYIADRQVVLSFSWLSLYKACEVQFGACVFEKSFNETEFVWWGPSQWWSLLKKIKKNLLCQVEEKNHLLIELSLTNRVLGIGLQIII